jgi:putative ABC transport system permease protein
MTLLIGALTLGCILGLLSLGVFLSLRICSTFDLTVDGTFGFGASVAAALLVRGVTPLVATAAAIAAGGAAGIITGLVHTRLHVGAVLAGVLTATALYSVCLFAMGSGSLSLAGVRSVVWSAERMASMVNLPPQVQLPGGAASRESLAVLVIFAFTVLAAAALLGLFLTTNLGLALRAAGNRPLMAEAVGINVNAMMILGLALSNALAALSGALLAQYEGFANIQMGAGALVGGLGGLLVGESLLGRRTLYRWIAGVVLGTLAFRLMIAGAVRAGFHPSALKLVTAALVLAVLVLPSLIAPRRARLGHA